MTTSTMHRGNIARGALPVLALGVAGVTAGWLVPSPSYIRLMMAGAVLVLLLGLVIRSPRSMLYLLLGWLAVLGTLRRLVTTVGSAGSLGDPLLLVGPAAWVLLAAAAISHGALGQRTRLANTVLFLTALLTVSVINPLQGSPLVGLGGFLLVVPPMLAFWVGRGLLDDETLRRVVIVVAGLAIPTAGYGLVQTLIGFPSWDARWIIEDAYVALNVGGAIRPFASFASAAEYAGFLAMGTVSWLALGRKLLYLPLALAPIGLLGIALWLESARGIIVFTLAAVWLILAARRGLPLRWALLVGVALLASLPLVVGRLAPDQFSSSATGDLVTHQVQGLSDPFGQESSLPGHISLVTNGLQQAIVNPLGRGVGAITAAAGKYGGSIAGTEADPGNAAVAVGAMGLVAYILLVLRGLPLAYRIAAQRRDIVALAALGILCVTFLQWLNGAQYAVAPLPWLVLGWLDRQPGLGASSADPSNST